MSSTTTARPEITRSLSPMDAPTLAHVPAVVAIQGHPFHVQRPADPVADRADAHQRARILRDARTTLAARADAANRTRSRALDDAYTAARAAATRQEAIGNGSGARRTSRRGTSLRTYERTFGQPFAYRSLDLTR